MFVANSPKRERRPVFISGKPGLGVGTKQDDSAWATTTAPVYEFILFFEKGKAGRPSTTWASPTVNPGWPGACHRGYPAEKTAGRGPRSLINQRHAARAELVADSVHGIGQRRPSPRFRAGRPVPRHRSESGCRPPLNRRIRLRQFGEGARARTICLKGPKAGLLEAVGLGVCERPRNTRNLIAGRTSPARFRPAAGLKRLP